jgi:hypothetical protein
LILEAGLKYKPLIAGLQELEFIEGIKISREEICAAFNVPPCMVGILDKATYSNYQQAEDIFWKQTILPKLRRIKPIINNTIITKYDKNIYFDFDLSGVLALQDDYETLSNIATKFFNIGIPPKQIIEKLNLPFEEYNGWDESYLPFSLQPAGSSNNQDESEVINDGENQSQEEGKQKRPEGTAGKKDLSKEIKKLIWKNFDKQSAVIEKRYKKIIDIFFSSLEKSVSS